MASIHHQVGELVCEFAHFDYKLPTAAAVTSVDFAEGCDRLLGVRFSRHGKACHLTERGDS